MQSKENDPISDPWPLFPKALPVCGDVRGHPGTRCQARRKKQNMAVAPQLTVCFIAIKRQGKLLVSKVSEY